MKYPPTLFRSYEPWELGRDDYPRAWHRLPDDWDRSHVERYMLGLSPAVQPGVKDIVRALAGNRCVRCQHPFVVGQSGTWEDSPDSCARCQESLWRHEPVDLGPVSASERAGTYRCADGVLATDDHIPYRGPRWVGGSREAEVGRLFYDELAGDVKPPTKRAVNWSACDERCRHGGPVRWKNNGDAWERDLGDVDGLISSQGVQQLRGVGVTEIEAAWRILTVHHLNERKFDLRWHNLVSLCQRCHLNVQRRVVMDRAYPWDHSDWFRPYVAAFYAAKYLGEELSYEDTVARQDELLALGKEHEAVERMPV